MQPVSSTTSRLQAEIDRLKNELQQENKQKNEYFIALSERNKTIEKLKDYLEADEELVRKMNTWLLNLSDNKHFKWTEEELKEFVEYIQRIIKASGFDIPVKVITKSPFDEKREQLEHLQTLKEKYEEEYKDKPELLNDVMSMLDEMRSSIIKSS